MFSSNKNHNKR